MKTLTKIMPWVLLGATFFAFPGFVLAGEATEIELKPPKGWEKLDFEIPEFVAAALRIVLVVAALIFFIMLLIGGIQWMLSGGDKAATEAARGKITAAIIGLVIVFAAWAIVTLINKFFGIDIFKLKIEPIGG